MKLKFNLLADDASLEARIGITTFIVYTVFQNNYDGPFNVVVDGTAYKEPFSLLTGSLYECLDACNKHYEEHGLNERLQRSNG